MFNKHAVLLVGLITCLAPVSSFADKIGDPAAPLTIKEWIKGKPVDVRDGKNIYVLEFWAALSPASRESIPKLNELQKNYKDKGVVIVGISDEPADKIREFMSFEGAQIEYGVAADDQRKTARNYMVAYGQNGIPHAFVVGKDGKVLWHGHPLGLDKVLDDIITNRYDLQKAIKADAVRAELDDYRMLARKGDPKAVELGRKLLADRTNDLVRLCDFAYRIITDVHNTNRNFVLAGEALDMAEKLAPGKAAPVVFTRGVVLFEQGKKEEGIALAKQAIDLTSNTNEMAVYNLRLNVMEGRKNAEDKKTIKGK
jgi:peroxiredoxin